MKQSWFQTVVRIKHDRPKQTSKLGHTSAKLLFLAQREEGTTGTAGKREVC